MAGQWICRAGLDQTVMKPVVISESKNWGDSGKEKLPFKRKNLIGSRPLGNNNNINIIIILLLSVIINYLASSQQGSGHCDDVNTLLRSPSLMCSVRNTANSTHVLLLFSLNTDRPHVNV